LETTIKDQDIDMTMYGYFGTNCSSTNPSYRLFLSKGTKCGALPVSISVTTDENKGEPKLVSYQITHSNGQAYIDLTDNPYCNQKDSQFSGQVAIGDCVNHSAGIRIGSVRVLNGASTNYTEFVHTSTVSTATSRITSLATTTTALLSTTTAKSQAAVSTYISWSGALLLLLL
jgi:hypothetical protein